jgi:ribosomal RNA-processing protein 9
LNSLVASEFPSDTSKLESRFKKCHQSPLTCVLADPSNTYIYTASLDNSITQWDFQTLQKVKVIAGARRKVKKFEGHTDNVMCLAISSNGQFLASGGKDKNIIIWKLPSLEYVGELKQHKDTVTALCFRKDSLDLYSASLDRMIKVWNVESMGYVETLYGHQDGILGLSSLAKEQCVSVGGRDRSLRCWQIINSGQLILRGGMQSKYILPKDYDLSNTLEQVVDNLDHVEEADNDKGKILKYMEGSLDCCGHIDEDHFVSGGDSGTLSVWSITRKKPVFNLNLAHGINPENLQPYPILSIAICPYTDVVITGSYSGAVKFWKINTQGKFNVEELISYEVEGYINGISICMSNESPKADLEGKTPEFTALLAVGRHFSHGRWNFEKFGRNGFQKIVVPLENKPKTFE